MLVLEIWVEDRHTGSTSGELHIASLHSEEIIALSSLGALLDHAIPVRQLAIEDVAEDLCVAVRMRREALSTIDSILIEDSQTAEVLEFRVVVVCEREGVVGVQPSVICVSSLVGATRHDFGVGESFGHGVLDCVDSCHGFVD